VTLQNAAQYVLKLPKAERDLPKWVTAIECLMLVGELGGDPMFPRIAMMQALRRHEPDAAPAPRRKAARAYNAARQFLPRCGREPVQPGSWRRPR
jgi:hypothetical protein